MIEDDNDSADNYVCNDADDVGGWTKDAFKQLNLVRNIYWYKFWDTPFGPAL